METVLRAAGTYLIVVMVFRLGGKRSLAQITAFDLVLLLIVAEADQQALLGNDFSLTTAALVILTLVGMDRAVEALIHRSPRASRILNDVPLILIEDGHLHRDRMDRVRVDEDEILEQARIAQGLERLEQVRFAVLERSGAISIVPYV